MFVIVIIVYKNYVNITNWSNVRNEYKNKYDFSQKYKKIRKNNNLLYFRK